MEELMDRQLVCCECGESFVFTTREQRFFLERGFSDPRRCRTCRDHRRTSRDDLQGAVYRAPDAEVPLPTRTHLEQRTRTPRIVTNDQLPGHRDRPLFEAVCSRCNAPALVPFKPTAGRPVLCRECFREVGGPSAPASTAPASASPASTAPPPSPSPFTSPETLFTSPETSFTSPEN